MLLAIDPGADSGFAAFDASRTLVACGLGHPGTALVADARRVLIECPRLRPWGEKNPNSILLVARNAGEWAGRCGTDRVEYLTPNDWKGSTSKEIDHRRTWSKLTPEEIRVLVVGCSSLSPRSAPIFDAIRIGLTKADKRANVLDAIGIGLFGVGRSR